MERWLPVVGFEGTYEVSDLGRVRSVDRVVISRCGVRRLFKGVIRRQFVCNSGYPTVTLRRNGYVPNRNVHVLVLQAFVGAPPDGAEGCHNDGEKLNCALSNLRYDSRSNNDKDREKHGGGVVGADNPQAKLTPVAVRFIRSMRGIERQSDLAAWCGISRPQVSVIQSGKAWKHLLPEVSPG